MPIKVVTVAFERIRCKPALFLQWFNFIAWATVFHWMW